MYDRVVLRRSRPLGAASRFDGNGGPNAHSQEAPQSCTRYEELYPYPEQAAISEK